MGGAIMVGVRLKSGEEILTERWTNNVPWMLHDPDFLAGKVKTIRSYMKQTGTSWPKTYTIDIIEPSEYGVILIDFKNKILFSRQNYCDIDEEIVCRYAGWLTKDGLKRLKALKRANRIKKVVNEITYVETNTIEITPDGNEMYTMTVDMRPFTVDHEIRRACNCWPEVCKFLKKNGWKSKTSRRR